MKNLTSLVSCIVLLFIFSDSAAQDKQISVSAVDRTNLNDWLNDVKSEGLYLRSVRKEMDKIDGNPYLSRDFMDGMFILNDGKEFRGPLRYNIYAQEIEFETPQGDICTFSDPGDVKVITINDRNFIYAPDNATGKKTYYEVLLTGEVSLLCHMNVIFEQPQSAGPYQSARPPRFIQKPDRFYLMTGENITPVKKISKMLTVFPDHQDELTQYIKNEKINMREAEDVLRVVRYYKSL